MSLYVCGGMRNIMFMLFDFFLMIGILCNDCFSCSYSLLMVVVLFVYLKMFKIFVFLLCYMLVNMFFIEGEFDLKKI